MDTSNSPAITQRSVELLPDGRMPPAAAAAFLDKSVQTLKTWRRLGKGPRYEREGRAIYYRLPWLHVFVAERTKPGR